MYTVPEVRGILMKGRKVKKIDEDVFDLGCYKAILTKEKVYIGRDLCRWPIPDDNYMNSARFRTEYRKMEDNVFESRKFPPHVGIKVGKEFYIFLDEWKRINRKRFIKELNHAFSSAPPTRSSFPSCM